MSGGRPLLLIVASLLAAVACDDGSNDAAIGDTASDAAITDVPGAPGTTDPTPDWVFAGSLSGALRQIVTWSDGFAALHFPDGDDPSSDNPRGELWYSSDGIVWDPARVPPEFEDVRTLAGHDGDLFALTGDPSDLTAPQMLWHRSGGSPWKEVLGHTLLHHIAVGADRVIAYQGSPFGILAVHDAATLEPVEFSDIPDLERPSEIPGPARVPDFASGAVIGLDDGFLARVGWGRTTVGTSDRVTWLFHSADGSTWTEHPAEATDDVEVGDGEYTAPTFDGLNLLTTDRGHPSYLDNRLLIDRWEHVPGDTDPGVSPSWVTDTGIDLRTTAPATVAMASATEQGFFDVAGGAIRHSLDGITWSLLDAPPTWSVQMDLGTRGLDEATILDGTDGLIAVGVHGAMDGWSGQVALTTEIWVAA